MAEISYGARSSDPYAGSQGLLVEKEMEIAIVILVLAFSIQTVRMWWWKRLQRETVRRWTATQEELGRAEVANFALETQLHGARAGQMYAKKYCDDWPEEIS